VGADAASGLKVIGFKIAFCDVQITQKTVFQSTGMSFNNAVTSCGVSRDLCVTRRNGRKKGVNFVTW
jgi:hypothetical protein